MRSPPGGREGGGEMQTKRIFASFAFTMLTVLLLLIVASRSGEADAGAADIDANLGPGMPAPTERAELPAARRTTRPPSARSRT